MSAITYKPEAAKKGHEQVIDPDYEQGADPDYDDTAHPDFDAGSDPDYDEGAQPDYGMEFADSDAQEGSQEYYKRNQK